MDRRTFVAGAIALVAGACRSDAGDGAGQEAVPDASNRAAAPSADQASTVPQGTAPPASTTPATATTAAAPGTTAAHDGRPAVFVSSGPGTRPQVALTFHTNGDPTLATALLDRLAARQAPITAFVVGEWLDQHPDLGLRLVADGHELANHTWSHQTMGELDRATIAAEIAGGAEALVRVIGGPGRWFRPSGMEIASEDVLVEAGLAGYGTVVGYNVDSLDFTDPGADAVRDNVTSVVAAGDIVSLHFGHADTVAAIDAIVDHLERSGLRPVTLSTLFAP